MRTPMILLLGCGMLVAVASTAEAVNLTGAYEGKWACKAFDGTKFKIGNKDATMEITQTGSAIAVHIDTPSAPFGDFFYNGTVIDDIAKPATKGEAVLMECGTSDVLLPDVENEMARATVKTKDEKGGFKATSFFADDLPEVGTCKYSFKRQSTTDPGIAPCP